MERLSALRDALRADEVLRGAYAELKAELLTAHAGVRRAYTAGKHAFIRDILAAGATPGPG